jgi:hypothetical protein
MNFYIPDRSTLDDFRGDRNSALRKHDTLILQTYYPFDHLLTHLARRDAYQRLNRLRPLAQAQETHFVTLRTGSLNACTEEDGLAHKKWGEGCYLCTGSFGACLRLIEGEFSVEFSGVVLIL